jgi:outer membrane protein assembly factor BamB
VGRNYLFTPILLVLVVSSASAQERLRKLLPTDAEAGRHGLVRRWYGQAPVDGVREKVVSASVVGNQLHLQTNASRLHVMDGESGKMIWTAQLGRPLPGQTGSAINSEAVFVISGSNLYRLNRDDGSQLWSIRLPEAPNAAPAADEERVVVSTGDGRMYVYDATTHELQWFYQMSTTVSMPAVLVEQWIACASEDGMLCVFQVGSRNPTFWESKAPLGAPLRAWQRSVLVPSRDYHLYSVDIRSTADLWRYSAGSEINDPVAVIGDELFLTPEGSGIHKLDAKTGARTWSYPRVDEFMAASAKRVYTTDRYGRLVILDRAVGRLLGMWDQHEFDFHVRNESNDRLYFVTKTGLVVCLHEKESKEPLLHKKPAGAKPADAEQPEAAPAEGKPAEPPAANANQ